MWQSVLMLAPLHKQPRPEALSLRFGQSAKAWAKQKKAPRARWDRRNSASLVADLANTDSGVGRWNTPIKLCGPLRPHPSMRADLFRAVGEEKMAKLALSPSAERPRVISTMRVPP